MKPDFLRHIVFSENKVQVGVRANPTLLAKATVLYNLAEVKRDGEWLTFTNPAQPVIWRVRRTEDWYEAQASYDGGTTWRKFNEGIMSLCVAMYNNDMHVKNGNLERIVYFELEGNTMHSTLFRNSCHTIANTMFKANYPVIGLAA